jgi:hypothetical protein
LAALDYREAAFALWGEAGHLVHDAYDRLQPLYPELPNELPIVIGLTDYGWCFGLTRGQCDAGPRITIASNAFERGALYVEDLVAHEMLHLWLKRAGQGSTHASADWYSAVRRLSPAVLGRADRPSLDDGHIVRKVKVGTTRTLAEMATWPHSFRPRNYDWGPPIVVPT